MAVTLYVFDHQKRVRAVAPENGVTKLIHNEAANTLDATVTASLAVETGECLGFRCVDGRFRLFDVTAAVYADDTRTIDVTATDAAVAELSEIIIEELQQLDVTANVALTALTAGTDWEVVSRYETAPEKSRAYFSSVWAMCTTFATLYGVRIHAYYEHAGGAITRKVIEIEEDVAVFRGRILQSKLDATKVRVTHKGRPYTRLYGLGPAQGSTDTQTNLTFADAEWSLDAGDPADKPKGQTWVEDPAAAAMYGVHAATVAFTDVEDAATLLQKTWDELQARKKPTVSAEATVQDMEMVLGYEHQQIRLGDLAALKLTTGGSVEARIVDIKRDYIRRKDTKLTIGDKKASITSQVSALISNATHTFERLTVYKNRFLEDEALIQLNAHHIQLNADSIIEQANQILLKADQGDLDAFDVRLTETALLIDGLESEISAQAEKISLNAYNITLKADKTEIDGFLTVNDSAAIAQALSAQDIYCNSLNATSSVWTEYISAYDITTSGLTVGGEAAATQPWVQAKIDEIYAENYATKSYVTGQGYVNETYVTNYTNSNFVQISVFNSKISSIESRLQALEG